MRLDKWLYYCRIYQSRCKSKNACLEGNILVNKIKKYNSTYMICKNDIITLIKNQKVKIIKVLNLPKNRISPKKVYNYYEII
ncbi:MAG: hypothetical protein CFH21_00249 [Alphaproteobacteria bacterium MarineAlpha5_Bin11]|nr:hypothetical protein [Pelagibacteraceae bacterium]PPR44661.1 MAG: hypothetical protein CFH21_00249 [Alphaproteobacteria bacterium MarineAlpha5_Bin11]PPR51211.1 MAG: hypothetical protein CFH20_00739 [Alphaproteobacteria bacterium MarineAlpha5_Bin10]|tara:strand:+ start:12463 stop:12708 length:246 start_codon:yes stop_codon:yes gene_type:complete